MNGNLVLTRNEMQRVFINTDNGLVKVTVLPGQKNGQVRLSFEAPPEIIIDREEVYKRRNNID
jgi:carbon storage regulator CsrA|tara:strand:+ start:1240 stop:1428 length:189 start_codon:yes stop_codon:yes gene_type:complete